MSITILPPEILSHICEYLEPQEWGALRITCHQIHGSTLEAYATRYFKILSLLLTRESLDNLEDIAESETLRGSVREIRIIPNLFEGWPEKNKERFRSPGLALRQQRSIFRIMRGEKEEPPFNKTEAKAELDALFTSYQAALEEHRAILDSELTAVLEKCLPRLENATTVGLRCYPIEFLLEANYRSFRCLGLRELKNQFNNDDISVHLTFTSFQRKMLSMPLALAFSQMVKAIIKSSHKVRALHTCGNIACGMKLGSIKLSESQYQSLLSLLTDLTTLHMCIRIKDNENDTFDEDAFKHLLSILVTVAPKLKVLTFAQWSPLEELSPLYFQDLSQNIRFSQLEELHLHSIELTVGNLKRFLQTAAPTLRRLSMKNVSLTDAIIGAQDPGPLTEERSSWGSSLSLEVINKIQELWKRSFELLADSPKLQFVQLSSLGYRGREIILQDDLYIERGQPDAQPDSNARRSINWPEICSDPTRGQSSLIDFYFDAGRANISLKRWIMQLRMEMCNPAGLATTQLPGTSGLSFNQDGVGSSTTYQPGEGPDPRRLAEMGALVV
ncbi:hypothetical protein CBS147339_8945 [Penicillium roqueforti]|uniref:uncharacterized protein n=1 Tax=Penicillium roqueforti TaxID=5082 RepID=UPI00190DF9C7|nr:uncharacterized protein LCP9604111_9692 [Penicillium roqueforti]KAF9237690.1 hypothetical protein LCP9604111_9692 [Penicillium roqueforti]KAI3065820.1 hypothetical protein CBS147339_8945 [Penicillium roqueforti]KAI3099674.1 hypothetical protein CBS147338_3645 [Penicillium roqueforti]KAI3118663.1 hypothetical protein CBS147330_8886 [Penicillium roqueforti]KAI3146326.1 hypothetical protein CBS147317_9415 [Penicillium roqueforti]